MAVSATEVASYLGAAVSRHFFRAVDDEWCDRNQQRES